LHYLSDFLVKPFLGPEFHRHLVGVTEGQDGGAQACCIVGHVRGDLQQHQA